MTAILELIDVVSAVREAVSAVGDADARREFKYPNDHFRAIGVALSEIYFRPDGILAVLEGIANGEKPDPAARGRLVEFNQCEGKVDRALDALVLDHGKRARNSIRQSTVMRMIRSSKMTVREGIQFAVNQAVTFDEAVDLEEVSRLIAQIKTLNEEIEKAEHDLRQFL
jgi:hypothetical protein